MNNEKKQITIFFAIPCGEFFTIENQCIKEICDTAGVKPIIVEDHSQTDNLWGKITHKIFNADYFVADVSSKSPNVILELGYSVGKKESRQNAIFIADTIEVPVDLQGFILQKYTNIRDFQNKLIKWMIDNIPGINAKKLNSLKAKSFRYFDEYFRDRDRFEKLWYCPSRTSHQLTYQGLRFSNAHWPIMTTHLALLQDYEFEFKGRIESNNLGWIVKGTRPFDMEIPTFCIMFNINKKGNLRTHIFNYTKVDPMSHYHIVDERKVQFNISKQGWFTFVTKVIGDEITIVNEGNELFREDFLNRYKEYYEFPNKQGEIGFRCHPGEIGIIRYVKIREI